MVRGRGRPGRGGVAALSRQLAFGTTFPVRCGSGADWEPPRGPAGLIAWGGCVLVSRTQGGVGSSVALSPCPGKSVWDWKPQ